MHEVVESMACHKVYANKVGMITNSNGKLGGAWERGQGWYKSDGSIQSRFPACFGFCFCSPLHMGVKKMQGWMRLSFAWDIITFTSISFLTCCILFGTPSTLPTLCIFIFHLCTGTPPTQKFEYNCLNRYNREHNYGFLSRDQFSINCHQINSAGKLVNSSSTSIHFNMVRNILLSVHINLYSNIKN